jgi:hypothetical protein
LNQAGNQPRERDYAYVGSFYAFAVWIGLGVMKVIEWFSKNLPQTSAAILATLLCLVSVPAVMAQQEWDDHDRSRKTLARDLAKDCLESCAPNAILFTFGDNDTYPLWYAQEVEGIRPDIRVINYRLLGIDWYINELRYKVNQSDPIDVIYSAAQIEGRKRDYIVYQPKPNIPEDRYYDLYDLMKNYAGSDDPDKMVDRGGGDVINTFPVRKLSVPVDTALVRRNGTVNPTDTIVPELRFEIPRGTLMKNDIAMLNIIAANKWKRPIYFTGYFSDLGFQKYLRKDGLTYRLEPVENQYINNDTMVNNLLHKFSFGNADVKNIYFQFDEENRRNLLSIRQVYEEFASDLADKGRKAEAREVLEKADKGMLQENFPYGMVSRANYHDRVSLQFLDACYRAGDTSLADKVSASVKKDLEQQMRFYNCLSGTNPENMADDKQIAESYLKALEQLKEMYYPKVPIIENGKIPSMDSGKSIQLKSKAK